MSDGAAEPLLSVRGLHTEFTTSGKTLYAVRGVSFDVYRGQVAAVVGESGSGKSATAHSLMRLIPSPGGQTTAGEVVFEGRDLLKLSVSEMRRVRGNDLAMIFQNPMTSFNPVFKIGRQLIETMQVHDVVSSKAEARKRAVDLLGLVGIASPDRRLDDYPYQFSGGMLQRAMIAMALSCSPKLLIADEPTTALDVTVQAGILELLGRLQRELDMAMLLITHDLGVVAGIADQVNVMYAGEIVESAPASALFDEPRHPYTLGLLGSVPSLDGPRKAQLQMIAGTPPRLFGELEGCPFEPRCAYALAECATQTPIREEITPDHSVACWVKPSGDREAHAIGQ